MPDTNPKFEKIPRSESINAFIQGMKNHNRIREIEELSDTYYCLTKDDGQELNVVLTNIYIVSEADVYEIINSENYNEVNVIITMSSWNSYSKEAKQMAKEHNIALFTYKEFYGALNYDGPKFINYVVKKRN